MLIVLIKKITSLQINACPVYNRFLLIQYFMLFGELNFMVVLFISLLFVLVVNVNTSVHLLLTAEFLWITLYALVFLIGLYFDNVNLLSLTFFFLVLSAVEFGLGLIIIMLQHIFNRSISLDLNKSNTFKLSSRFFNKFNTNRYKFM